MEILVTGASGFVGTALCGRLSQAGHRVAALGSAQADLRRPDALERFNDRHYDQIFHLAAWTQAGDFCLHHPGQQWIINQQINATLLAWWQKDQPQAKLISMGTSCCYAPDLDQREENYLLGRPIESLYTYAMTKRMLHVGQMALAKQYGLTSLTLVPSTLYGPGYHLDQRQMHFIFDLIRKILRGKFYAEPVVLWGDGTQRRELIYLDDFVDIVLKLAPACANDLVNVGAGTEHSIADFARMICSLVDYDATRIRYDATRYVGAKCKCLRVEKLRRLLPDLPLTPLDEGLRRTVDWFIARREKLLPAP